MISWRIGLDVGATTLKAVVVDVKTDEIILRLKDSPVDGLTVQFEGDWRRDGRGDQSAKHVLEASGVYRFRK